MFLLELRFGTRKDMSSAVAFGKCLVFFFQGLVRVCSVFCLALAEAWS